MSTAINPPHNPTLQEPTSPTRAETERADTIEDANLPGSLPTLRKPYITFLKPPVSSSSSTAPSDDLPARISRVFYINPYGQEIRPPANPRALAAIHAAQAIVYSIGSLYTSIVPSLLARGVGDALAGSNNIPGRSRVAKVLILNGTGDRETGPSWDAMSAMDFVKAVWKAAGAGRRRSGLDDKGRGLSAYVTHVVYMEGEAAPKVDRAEFAREGIETVRVYGRAGRYDEKALGQALEAVIGRDSRTEKGRRNTLVA